MVNPQSMTADASAPQSSLRDEVKNAVLWRSGSQIAAQLVAWCSTLAVIRILDPADYGLFAMTQVVLTFLNFLNGYGFASSLVQDREIDSRKVRQAFGLMLLVNGVLKLRSISVGNNCAGIAACESAPNGPQKKKPGALPTAAAA